MDNELQSLIDAIEILNRAKVQLSIGPMIPWRFLVHATNHIQKQLDGIAAVQLSAIFADPEQAAL